jgi:hypothetical protein
VDDRDLQVRGREPVLDRHRNPVLVDTLQKVCDEITAMAVGAIVLLQAAAVGKKPDKCNSYAPICNKLR